MRLSQGLQNLPTPGAFANTPWMACSRTLPEMRLWRISLPDASVATYRVTFGLQKSQSKPCSPDQPPSLYLPAGLQRARNLCQRIHNVAAVEQLIHPMVFGNLKARYWILYIHVR